MNLRIEELKREIEYSKATGALTTKSNCPHCYETGIEGYIAGKPLLCRCVKIYPELMEKQNRGELKPN